MLTWRTKTPAAGTIGINTPHGHSMTEVTEIYAHLAAYDADINKMTTTDETPATGITLKLVK